MLAHELKRALVGYVNRGDFLFSGVSMGMLLVVRRPASYDFFASSMRSCA